LQVRNSQSPSFHSFVLMSRYGGMEAMLEPRHRLARQGEQLVTAIGPLN
jgi:hypothetical protein